MKTISLRMTALGAVFLLALATGAVLVYKQFRGEFAGGSEVKVSAPRVGLLMDAGSQVKMRGVQIGRVGSVHATDSGATLTLAISPGFMRLIPANATARIVPPTAFGAKYVELDVPSQPSAESIRVGATIDADHVTVEVNEAFTNLMALLKAAQPAKVNAALNAVADTLRGNGADLGQLITSADAYLASLNPALPQINHDIATATTVLNLYADLVPGITDVARNVTVTSQTLVAKQRQLDTLLRTFGSTATDFTKLLNDNGPQLIRTLTLLEPVTGVLEKYSPEISCTVKGLQAYNKVSSPVLGGDKPGVTTTTRFHLSQDPYTYPNNLPEVRANNGPGCYGLPLLAPGQVHQDHVVVNTGANPTVNPTNTRQTNPAALLQLLLGVG